MWRIFLLTSTLVAGQSWHIKNADTTAVLRGVSVVNDQIVWASGTKGTIRRTINGGISFDKVNPPGTADLDFRDIEALSGTVAYVMSAGEGRTSRIYKTTDGGESWTMQKANGAEGFWNSIAMWDATHGILMGDPVDGKFTILTTNDGLNWTPVEGPKAEVGEVAFAGGGQALAVSGTRDAWFATGGTGGGRVFHSVDSGKTWTVVRAMKPTADSAGIYALGFAGTRGVAVGGDFAKSSTATFNIAVFEGGKWSVPDGKPSGYRSGLVHVDGKWIAVGTMGSDISSDNGRTWKLFDQGAFNAISVAGNTVWAVGPAGRMAILAQ